MADVLVPFVNYLIVLDNDGERLLAKYYDGKPKSEQAGYEAALHKKTKSIVARNEAEIMMGDNEIVVYRSGADCKFYVSGPSEENELILISILEVIFETVSALLRGQVDKRTMLENLELVLLTIDEAIDHGHIMEIDSNAVCNRVMMKTSETTPKQNIGDITISQAFGLARDQLMKSMGPRDGGY